MGFGNLRWEKNLGRRQKQAFPWSDKKTRKYKCKDDQTSYGGDQSQYSIFKIGMVMVLIRCSRNLVVGKRVGVLNHYAVGQYVVMPVGQLVEKKPHHRGNSEYNQYFSYVLSDEHGHIFPPQK